MSVIEVRPQGGKKGDDTAQLQLALDHACPGGRVRLWPGTYRTTDTLLFDSGQVVESLESAWNTLIEAQMPQAVFAARTWATLATYYVQFRGLSLYNANQSCLPGSIGLDLRNNSRVVLEGLRLRFHDRALWIGETVGQRRAGYDSRITDFEIASCWVGVHADSAANAWRIVGGRVQGCEVGFHLVSAIGTRIDATVERCSIGVLLDTSAWLCSVTGHYEANAGAASAPLPGQAAILIRGRHNIIEAGTVFSHGSDAIIIDSGEPDDAQTNVCHATRIPSTSRGVYQPLRAPFSLG